MRPSRTSQQAYQLILGLIALFSICLFLKLLVLSGKIESSYINNHYKGKFTLLILMGHDLVPIYFLWADRFTRQLWQKTSLRWGSFLLATISLRVTYVLLTSSVAPPRKRMFLESPGLYYLNEYIRLIFN